VCSTSLNFALNISANNDLQIEQSDWSVIPNKVFATATIDGGKRAAVIPNYLRPRDEGVLCFFFYSEFILNSSREGFATYWVI
jgi:hypothetical protein